MGPINVEHFFDNLLCDRHSARHLDPGIVSRGAPQDPTTLRMITIDSSVGTNQQPRDRKLMGNQTPPGTLDRREQIRGRT